jgi:hypothetical protein
MYSMTPSYIWRTALFVPSGRRQTLKKRLMNCTPLVVGYEAGKTLVMSGEEGAKRMDVTGKEHGLLGRLSASYSKWEM